ncbi:MAG: hypothetical protein JNL89_13870 [Rhodanobacteraceae bacterium]|jgi:hypothetical protein|nr:hypothetical protein [Rhodanobacteraceae bacterium]
MADDRRVEAHLRPACLRIAQRRCRSRSTSPAGCATIRGPFSPDPAHMETNALSAKLADLRQRVDALRGFL